MTVELHADGQKAHLARSGQDAFRYLSLDHDHQQLWPSGGLQEVTDGGGGDVVGQIGDDLVGHSWGNQFYEVGTEYVRFHDFDIGEWGEGLSQDFDQAVVQLDCHDVTRLLRQWAGQYPKTRTHLNDMISGSQVCGGDYFASDAFIVEEILPQALARS